jgi:L-ribulose-5-phosphate 3-epimerase
VDSCALVEPWKPASKLFNPEIGVMQGRLLPPVGGRIQAFPGEEWEREFDIAAEVGLQSIEWIYETPIALNPLSSRQGISRIRAATARTQVKVEYVCADYFMEFPLVRTTRDQKAAAQKVLSALIDRCAECGVIGIEIPCVDNSAIRHADEFDEVVAVIEPLLPRAERLGVTIGLETSLGPSDFRDLLGRFQGGPVRANYDSGNSASLGYLPHEEFEAYGHAINNVHIKDRVLGGSTVPLGTGAADIPLVLELLQERDYAGGLILQVARGENGKEKELLGQYVAQLRQWLKVAVGQIGSRAAE